MTRLIRRLYPDTRRHVETKRRRSTLAFFRPSWPFVEQSSEDLAFTDPHIIHLREDKAEILGIVASVYPVRRQELTNELRS
jgi:hypothetical protein